MGGKASRTINEGNGRLTIGLRLVISVTVEHAFPWCFSLENPGNGGLVIGDASLGINPGFPRSIRFLVRVCSKSVPMTPSCVHMVLDSSLKFVHIFGIPQSSL